jgi:hypothetical protein
VHDDAELAGAVQEVGAHRGRQSDDADHAQREGDAEQDQDDRLQVTGGDRPAAG